jgi:cytochrome c-type protein NapC
MNMIGTLRARLQAVGWATAAGLFVAGIVFWGGFNWVVEYTNSEQFCIGCHEMQKNVYTEYQTTSHYSNRTGVRATCSDCHVPKDWGHKIVRKVLASNEIFHKLLGTIDNPEKFNERRIRLARSEWARMKATDSRECRNCHNYTYMDLAEQGRRASTQHTMGFAERKTCIDCHKGVAHILPPIEQDIGAPRLQEARAE